MLSLRRKKRLPSKYPGPQIPQIKRREPPSSFLHSPSLGLAPGPRALMHPNRPEAAPSLVGSRPRPPSLGLRPIHLTHPPAGYFLRVQKVPKNTPKPRFWIPLSNRPASDFVGALPLKLPNPSGIRSAAGFSSDFARRPFEGIRESLLPVSNCLRLPKALVFCSKKDTSLITRAVRRSRTPAPPVMRWPQAQRRFGSNRATDHPPTDRAKRRESSPKGAGALLGTFPAREKCPCGANR